MSKHVLSPAHFVQGSTIHLDFVHSSSASLTARFVAFSTVVLSHSSTSPRATATPTTTQLQYRGAPYESSSLKTAKNAIAVTSQITNLKNIVTASRGSSIHVLATHKRGSAHLGFRSVSDWLRIASTKPDSFIPSRIADFITQYATQSPIAVPIADITIAPKKNCIVPSVSKKSWPFTARDYFKREALEGAPLAGKVSGAIAQELPPVGNTGGSFRSVPNV